MSEANTSEMPEFGVYELSEEVLALLRKVSGIPSRAFGSNRLGHVDEIESRTPVLTVELIR